MKSSMIATILAALSLGGVAVLYVKVDKLSDDISLARDPTAHRRDVPEPEAPASSATARYPRLDSGAGAVRIPTAQAPQGEDKLEERIARLERRQDKFQKEARHARPLSRFTGGRKFARSVDDLARTLKLTPTQKDRVQDAIDRGRQQIEDILKIPDETGKSPHERRQARRKKLREAIKNKDTSGLLSFSSDLFSYRNEQIPGRNATYGGEIDRVKRETRDEVAATLDADQKKTFDDTTIDPLLGGSPAMSIGVFHTADGEGGGTVIVEGRTTAVDEVAIEVPESGKDETEEDDR